MATRLALARALLLSASSVQLRAPACVRQLCRSPAGGASRGPSLADRASEVQVARDTVLFSNDTSRFCTMLRLFAVTQALVWFTMYQMVATLQDIPVPRDDDKQQQQQQLSWYRRSNLGSSTARFFLSAVCVVFGVGLGAMSILISMRSINRIVLLRGGQTARFFYSAPKHSRFFDVPLEKVSAKMSRHQSQSILAIKIRDTAFYYWLDMSGDFSEPFLFDWSVGVNRAWNK